MTNKETKKEKPTKSWILRIIKYIHKRTGIHPFTISISIFGIFPYLILSFLYHGLVDDIGLICAFLWMGIGPYILYRYLRADGIIDRTHTHLLPLLRHREEEFNDLYFDFIKDINGMRHLIIGVPLALIVAISCYYSFRSSFEVLPLSILLLSLFILSILASIGFFGVLSNTIFIRRVCKLPLVINPLHHDKFGGMKFIASYNVRIALLFSSGCLLIPLAFETFKRLDLPHVYYMSVAATIFFTLFVVAAFVIPLYCLHIKARDEKSKILRAGERRIIDEVFPLYQKKEKLDPDQIYPIFIRYMIEEKIEEMTTIPVDAKLLVEIGIILVEPIVITKGIFELMELVH